MYYAIDTYQRQLEAIVSVQLYMQNTEGLSDEALIDEMAEVMYDIDDDEIIELIVKFQLKPTLSRKQRKKLCMCYVLFHSTHFSEELC